MMPVGYARDADRRQVRHEAGEIVIPLGETAARWKRSRKPLRLPNLDDGLSSLISGTAHMRLSAMAEKLGMGRAPPRRKRAGRGRPVGDGVSRHRRRAVLGAHALAPRFVSEARAN
jgi:hypothetical protein